MITMPKELKEKWVAALRSGEYQQCVETLHNGTGYCCLGVLQMVADGEVESGDFPSAAWIDGHDVRSDRHGDHPFWHIADGGWEYDLPSLNDSGESFNTIADIIEENVRGV